MLIQRIKNKMNAALSFPRKSRVLTWNLPEFVVVMNAA